MDYPSNRPSQEQPTPSQASVDPTQTRWVEDPTPVAESFNMDQMRQQVQSLSDGEEEMDQQPSLFDQPGKRPFAFPSPPVPQPSQQEELANLKAPVDIPVQALEKMRNRQGFKRFINYPSRVFHLRPQPNLRKSDNLDWETAFLWSRVSMSRCNAAYLENFPYPALDMPLLSFPEEILRQGMTMRVGEMRAGDAFRYAVAVLESTGRAPSDPEPDPSTAWRDVRKIAARIIGQLERRGHAGAIAVAAKIKRHQLWTEDYDSFFRLRGADRRPTMMGFRGARDIFFLDDDYVTDFLARAAAGRGGGGARLIPFLGSRDAAKVKSLAVSALSFRGPRRRAHLCHAIARTFPGLEQLVLVSVAAVDLKTARAWEITVKRPMFTGLRDMAEVEVERNGGSSYLADPREDPAALFDLDSMSPALVEATGAYADGRGRAHVGEPSRTPLVAYGIKAGLLHDPDPDQEQPPADQDPPFIAAVQHMLTAAYKAILRRREAAARATRAEALAKLTGRRTMLPRPIRRGPVWSAPRLYRSSEETPVDYVQWHLMVRDKQAARRLGNRSDAASSSETDPSSEAPVPSAAAEVGPSTRREHARVEASVLVFHQYSFDKNVQKGWTGFGPGVDLSHFYDS